MTAPPPGVGPVLIANDVGRAVVSAISMTQEATVLDRGAYLRVSVPGRCVVSRAEVERILGATFSLPADLELVMPAFDGALTLSDDEAVWSARRAGEGDP